ncbi:MAG: ribosomal protein S18-alanine N-acetyltransferase [Clostridia bacterium]|nr:ribosomal protein S18-alanine N-acetyltransferase [Clostridia bacterium]
MRVGRIAKEHLAGIAALEKLSFAAPWSEDALSFLLREEAVGFACLDDAGIPVAYAGMLTVLDEGQITNVATNPAYRRQGLADAVLTALLTEARLRGLATVSLEVRESNLAAISLYEKHGFSVVGKRNHFYKNPREHALVMLCSL